MDTHAPIQPDELEGLFGRFAALGPCALAVSGGSDSTALMVLCADWLRQRRKDPRHCTVLTVDHGLRQSSADEARAVAATAVELGFCHATLPWEGQKPRAGIQAAARAARYRLMGDYMRTHDVNVLLTGHTRDDQAETLLMRLARGSGLDGLCAMAPLTPLGEQGADTDGELWIGRPFLDVPKLTLRTTLEARKLRWMEDPSNIAPEFERARLRAARMQLDALGLTPDMLALSAARLARARRAIDAMVREVCDPKADAVRVDETCGAVLIDRGVLRQTPEEVALRVLERAIVAAGGGERPSLGKLEAVVRAVWEARTGDRSWGLITGASPAQGRWTLARALITAEPDLVRIERELGREPLPELTLVPGAAAIWDGRFRVSVGQAYAGGALTVRALGEGSLRDLRRRRLVAEGPARGAATAPALWRGDEIVAAPSLGFWNSAHAHEQLDAVFAGLGLPHNVAGAQAGQPAVHRGRSASKGPILS